MSDVNCYIPIRLRLAGRVDDECLDRLERQLVPLISARLALAERTVAGRVGSAATGGREIVREDYQSAAHDTATAGYRIPSYQPPTGGRRVVVPVKQASGPRGLSDQQRERVRTAAAQLENDDGRVFQEMLAGTRARAGRPAPDPLNLEILRAFARQDPAKFRKLLLAALTQGDEAIAREFQFKRTEDNIIGIERIRQRNDPAVKEALRLLAIATDALHLANLLPEAAGILREWERGHAGLRRLAAPIELLIRVRQQLLNYLRQAAERTDPDVIKALALLDLEQLPVLVAVTVTGRQAPKIIADLEQDLIAQIRWIAVTWEKVQEIDKRLALYRIAQPQAVDQLEEVVVLRQARSRYLDALAMNPFPTRARIVALLEGANRFYASWRNAAAKEKLEHVKAGVEELNVAMDRAAYSATGDVFTDEDNAYNRKLDDFRREVQDFTRRTKDTRKQTPGEPDLAFAGALQQQVGELQVQRVLLTWWFACLQLPRHAREHDIGDDDQQTDWRQRAAKVREEIKQQYDHLDLDNLPAKMQGWQNELKKLVDQINEKAKEKAESEGKKRWWRLGITLVALAAAVLTEGALTPLVGEVGLTATETTLYGAAAFTTVQAAGRVFILHEHVGAGELLLDFGENAAASWALRWLNLRFANVAAKLLPGRDLAQFAIVIGADATVGGGITIALNLIETGQWPDDWRDFLISTAVVAAAGAMLGSLRTKLEQLSIKRELLAQFDLLRQDGAAILGEMQSIGLNPTEAQRESLKQRALGVFPELEVMLGRLAGIEFSDADLAKLGLSRPRVLALAKIVAEYGDIIRNSRPPAPTGRAGAARALPSPAAVIPNLVELGPDTFAYQQRPEQAAAALKRAGYHVDDTGGVLQLTGPGAAGRPLLLLPAETPSAGGASLLQRQRGAALRTEAASLERETAALRTEADDLERRAAELKATRPDRADRLIEQAARRRRIATQLDSDVSDLRRQATEFESGRRSATADLPGPEELDALFAEARAETDLIRVPLSRAERDPALLPRLVRPLMRSRTGNRVVFRVEAGGSRELVTLGIGGEVTLQRGTTIHLNFGSFDRALEFLRENRRTGARIVAFEVDERWVRSVRAATIPEHGTRALRGQPRLVDVRFAHDQIEVPSNLVDELQQFIIPGSGREVQVSP